MAWFDLLCITTSIFCGVFSYNTAIIGTQYCNILIGICAYLLMNSCIHSVIDVYTSTYKSHPSPKHLIVLSPGYLGHHLFKKGIMSSFKEKGDSLSVMVFISKFNNGFFFHSLFNNNDGIHKGAKRLHNEIKHVIESNKSIEKISFIGGSAGGLYNRCCLGLFEIESMKNGTFCIGGRSIKAMNFITLATPNLGVKDVTKRNKIFCNLTSEYDAAKWLNDYHLLPVTLKQFLLFDREQLIVQMATTDSYLRPLQLFENRMCFANAKHDKFVSVSSGLMMQKKNEIGQAYWSKMISQRKAFLMMELEKVEFKNDDCWSDHFRKEISWTKIIVCWNQNYLFRAACHYLLAAPAFSLKASAPIFQTIHKRFVH